MIGRIFPISKFENNKYFHIAIETFNNLSKIYSNFELKIIGSIKHEEYYKYLCDLIDCKNIKILPDISNEEKNNILSKTQYYIQLTGFEDKYFSNQEHFGITLIEALNYRCIPICFSGGFSPYILDDNYLVKNRQDLYEYLNDILSYKKKLDPVKHQLDKYSNLKFIDNFSNFL